MSAVKSRGRARGTDVGDAGAASRLTRVTRMPIVNVILNDEAGLLGAAVRALPDARAVFTTVLEVPAGQSSSLARRASGAARHGRRHHGFRCADGVRHPHHRFDRIRLPLRGAAVVRRAGDALRDAGLSTSAPPRRCARPRTVRTAEHLQTQRIRARVTLAIGETDALGAGMNIERAPVVTRMVGSMATRRLGRGVCRRAATVCAAARRQDVLHGSAGC